MAKKTDQRRSVPSVTVILKDAAIEKLVESNGRPTVTDWIRSTIDSVRSELLDGTISADKAVATIVNRVTTTHQQNEATRLRRLVNATGIILHTNLGRAPLSDAAIQAISQFAGSGNVEINPSTGVRSYRGHQLQPLFQSLTGCEDSLVVNNNAGATLLTLKALCAGKEVIISRGQLIEIGGSFRLPEIFEFGGVTLKEVGTTNRTKIADYENAIGPNTAAIMKVHPSNYRVVGFTSEPDIPEIVELCQRHNILSIDDIGSGSLVDVRQYKLPNEPTFQDSLKARADVVLGSGDKLLGGPQAGIILGRSELIKKIRHDPLARCIRVDKLAMAALDATLRSYLVGTAESDIPVLELLGASVESLRSRAEQVVGAVEPATTGLAFDVRETTAAVGGGSVPGVELPTVAIFIRSTTQHQSQSADNIAAKLRSGTPGLIPRIQDDNVVIDFRSIRWRDDADVVAAIKGLSTPG